MLESSRYNRAANDHDRHVLRELNSPTVGIVSGSFHLASTSVCTMHSTLTK